MTYIPAPAVAGALRLHLNENTAGCSPSVIAALRSMSRQETAFYPDYSAVTRACEAWIGVPPGWLQLTNGLDEGLHVVALAARLRTADADLDTPVVLVVDPAFEMYDVCAEAVELRTAHLAPLEGFEFPLAQILAAIRPQTRLIYLTDPNNPTGLPIPAGAVAAIATAAPHATVFVDEAYAEFSGRSSVSLLSTCPNLVIGRTFAKAHGLAALRAGAILAQPGTLAPLRRLLPPYSINIAAVRALEAAIGDPEYLQWSVEQAKASKALIYERCAQWGFECWPSEGNFVLVRVGARATALVQTLAEGGVLIRDRSRQPGCDGCVRITAGVVEATRRCLDAMETALAARPD